MNPFVPYLVLVWFLAPWLIVAFKGVRVSVYEVRSGIYAGLWPFGIAELFRRIAEKRRTDPKYDQMRAGIKRWIVVCAVWWFSSFILIVAFAFGFAAWSPE
ncbi:MAG TPA: hypothetical protein VGD88_14470 [Opitutaceae bacterium]